MTVPAWIFVLGVVCLLLGAVVGAAALWARLLVREPSSREVERRAAIAKAEHPGRIALSELRESQGDADSEQREFLRALTDVLKRSANAPGPEKRALARVRHSTAPANWEAAERHVDGRVRDEDPVCMAREAALAQERRLGLVAAPERLRLVPREDSDDEVS